MKHHVNRSGGVGSWLRVGAAMAFGVLASLGMQGCEQKNPPVDSAPKTSESAPSHGAATNPGEAKPAVTADSVKGDAPKVRPLRIGVIAKSQSNPVFQAARTGALAAGAELSKKYGVKIDVIWQTPTNEDAQKQGQYIEQLVGQGVDAISVSCTDGDVLKLPIDSAVDRGVLVVTFDSDSPKSKRFAYYGIDDEACGREVMKQLAKAMGDTGGPIAILGGNQTAPNLQARIRGVKQELDSLKAKGFTLKDVYYHKETAPDAAATVQQVQTANPDIAGWAMVGGWPLFTKDALTGVAGRAKVVSVDTLREELAYVAKGEVQALIGQDCYGWGHESVRIAVEKLLEGKDPASPVVHFDLQIVTKDNVKEFEGIWDKWLEQK
ncbi:MAG: substrate-binding domain-containing protein [Phycisphaerales bacterium]|nr:MAG: substrate-binding domain-containing protein [Phycisphaerales bacterium]